MSRWEIFFATLALAGMASAAISQHQAWRQTLRADAFQDAYNQKVWKRRDERRKQIARDTAILRALAADAMAAEHAAALNKKVLEQQ